MVYIAQHATELRTSLFFIGLALFGLGGILFPYRAVDRRRDSHRWLNNLGLTFLSGITIFFLAPFSLVSLATHLSQGPIEVWAIGLQVALLDLVIYLQHVLFHKVGFLWRLHRVHHSDTEFDSTTALRFHSVEIFISFFIKALAISTFGISPSAVVVFEVLLNFSAMFNHGNFSLPAWVEKINLLVVTPDMHRIHHSIDVKERDSNYGFFLSIWDRTFNTYRRNSKFDLKNGRIGTPQFRSRPDQTILRLLIQPFVMPMSENSSEKTASDFRKSS